MRTCGPTPGGGAARQPRAERLLQTQEEVAGACWGIASGVPARNFSLLPCTTHCPRGRPGRWGDGRGRRGQEQQRGRRWRERGERDGRQTGAGWTTGRAAARRGRRGRAAPAAATGPALSRRVPIRDGGGLVAMGDTATLRPPDRFHYERMFFIGDAGRRPCYPAMPACAIRPFDVRMSRQPSRTRTSRRRWPGPGRPTVTAASPTAPTSTSCAPTARLQQRHRVLAYRPRPARPRPPAYHA